MPNKKNKNKNVKVNIKVKPKVVVQTKQKKNKNRTKGNKNVNRAVKFLSDSQRVGLRWGRLVRDPFDNHPVRLGGNNFPTQVSTGFCRGVWNPSTATGGTYKGLVGFFFNLNNNSTGTYASAGNIHPPLQIGCPWDSQTAFVNVGNWDYFTANSSGTVSASGYPSAKITGPGELDTFVNNSGIGALGVNGRFLAGGMRLKILCAATDKKPLLYCGISTVGSQSQIYAQTINNLLAVPQTRMVPGLNASVCWMPSVEGSMNISTCLGNNYSNSQTDVVGYILITGLLSTMSVAWEIVGHFESVQGIDTLANITNFANGGRDPILINEEVMAAAESVFGDAPLTTMVGQGLVGSTFAYLTHKYSRFIRPEILPMSERNIPMFERKEEKQDDEKQLIEDIQSFELASSPATPLQGNVSKTFYESIIRRAQQLPK